MICFVWTNTKITTRASADIYFFHQHAAVGLWCDCVFFFFFNKELMTAVRYGTVTQGAVIGKDNNNNRRCLPGPSREILFYGQEVMRFRLLAAARLIF